MDNLENYTSFSNKKFYVHRSEVPLTLADLPKHITFFNLQSFPPGKSAQIPASTIPALPGPAPCPCRVRRGGTPCSGRGRSGRPGKWHHRPLPPRCPRPVVLSARRGRAALDPRSNFLPPRQIAVIKVGYRAGRVTTRKANGAGDAETNTRRLANGTSIISNKVILKFSIFSNCFMR